MQKKRDLFVALLFSIISIIKPIPYEEVQNNRLKNNIIISNTSDTYSNKQKFLATSINQLCTKETYEWGKVRSEVDVLEDSVAVITAEELEFLEGNGQVQLTKGVDAFPVTPSYPGRPQGARIPADTSKPPRAPSGFSRMPPRVIGNGLYGGPGGNGVENPGDDSNPGKPNSEQCQDPRIYSSPKKKKSPHKFIGIDFEAAVEFNENGDPIYTVTKEDGSKVVFTYEQALEKYYHFDIYGLECPKGFDKNYASNLYPKARREYIKRTVPRDKILEFQRANVKSIGTENLLTVPGFIGSRKDPGTLYINKETRQVHFVNDRTNQWRTTVLKSKKGLGELALNGFHLFPNAGKKN